MKRTFTILAIVAVVAVGGFFGWRYWNQTRTAAQSNFQTLTVDRGDLTAIVGATGVVRANQTAVLTWQTSGQIGLVDVKVTDPVQTGQVLAQLETSSLSQSIILAQADLVTARRNLENLTDSEVARATAQQALAAAEKELKDAKDKRASKNYARAGDDTIEVARNNLILAKDDLQKAEDYFKIFENRPETDPLRAQAFSALANARQKRDRAEANLNWLLSGPDVNEVAEADARVALAEARLKDAQREWDRLKNGPDPDDIAAAKARIAAIEATLALSKLDAPFNGTLTSVSAKPGDQVNPGTVAMRIDDLSRLLVDVQITEVDINRIKPGQKATLTFDAIQDKTYNAGVVEVARVGTTQSGVVNFTVTLELTDPDTQVLPGMTAAVNIITDQLNDVVLIPNRAVRLREGKRVVYLLQNNTPVMTEIELGLTSDQFSQLLSDQVKVGDVLVLNPPTTFQAGPPPGVR